MAITESASVDEGGHGYFADPALSSFGSQVPLETVGDANRFVVRNQVALVATGTAPSLNWTTAEKVTLEHISDWLIEKRERAGKDARLIGAELCCREHRLLAGCRRLSFTYLG